MLDYFYSLDVKVLLFINQNLQSEFLDFLFPFLTHLQKMKWVQFVLLPLTLGIWFYKDRKKAFKIFTLLVLAVGLSDLIGYKIIKPTVNRVRPNNQAELASQLRLLRHPGSQSFPSNHAMNSFALATVLLLHYRSLAWLLLPWAFMIGFSRVYAGVHYPSDVVGGALLGFLIGYFVYTVINSTLLKKLWRRSSSR